MRVGIEASPLLVENKTGVEHYTQRLLAALFKIDPRNEYWLTYLAFFTKADPELGVSGQNIHKRRISWLPGKIYNATLRSPIGLAIDLISGLHVDVFLFLNFARWPLQRTKNSVVIVHDLSFIEFPQVIKTLHHRLYLSWTVPRSIKKASAVIAISESTKNGIIKHYGTAPEKISVVPPAVDHDVYKPMSKSAIASLKKKHNIVGEYLLYIGTLEPRKNILAIVAAYKSLPDSVRNKYQLVIGGNRGWGNDEIESELSSLPKGELLRLGYVDDADMAALYSGATMFLYPSVYEGWGMQVLEAMACGTPVITANNSSLVEAGGDAAAFVTVGEQEHFNALLLKVLDSPSTRRAMSFRGIKHAATFSWDKSASLLLDVLKRVNE